MITTGTLKKLAKGKLKVEDVQPFLIAVDQVRMRFLPACFEKSGLEYVVIYGNSVDQNNNLNEELCIDKHLARSLIKNLGMECVAHTDGGECRFYEAPGQPFLEKFSGKGVFRKYKS